MTTPIYAYSVNDAYARFDSSSAKAFTPGQFAESYETVADFEKALKSAYDAGGRGLIKASWDTTEPANDTIGPVYVRLVVERPTVEALSDTGKVVRRRDTTQPVTATLIATVGLATAQVLAPERRALASGLLDYVLPLAYTAARKVADERADAGDVPTAAELAPDALLGSFLASVTDTSVSFVASQKAFARLVAIHATGSLVTRSKTPGLAQSAQRTLQSAIHAFQSVSRSGDLALDALTFADGLDQVFSFLSPAGRESMANSFISLARKLIESRPADAEGNVHIPVSAKSAKLIVLPKARMLSVLDARSSRRKAGTDAHALDNFEPVV